MKQNKANDKVRTLKSLLVKDKIDFFLLPNCDEFFSEYLPDHEKRIEFLTGFSGSNAVIIFGQKKSYFFTDGRYILQAKDQLRNCSLESSLKEQEELKSDLMEFEIFNLAEKPIFSWLESNLTAGARLAIDAKLVSVNFATNCQKIVERKKAKLVFLKKNFVDKIRPQQMVKNNQSELFFCDEKVSGQISLSKRSQVLQQLAADALIITKPENLCWLLNLRAADIEFTPIFLAYGILFKNGDVELFLDEERATKLPPQAMEKVRLIRPDHFESRLATLVKSSSTKKIQIDPATTNYWLHQLLKNLGFEISLKSEVIEELKSRKNETEIFGAKKAHEIDGLAVTKFLFWLEDSLKNGQEIDEISAEDKLLKLRQKNPDFLYPSFATISSFASNGAIVHYRSSEKTNKKISGNSLYLVDSGGQYFGKDFCATTDVTRTVAIGKPSSEMIEDFTHVLKGHIALACTKFPLGTNGSQLDILARFHLWQAKKDYDHGTGHGVGSFLSVHEGPCSISRKSSQPLLPGIILSNEPGFYQEGKYGIRIENLMLVEKCEGRFLQFQTLTLAPLDPNLINFSMLNDTEKKWLSDYHHIIFEKLQTNLSQPEKTWLQAICTKFEQSLIA